MSSLGTLRLYWYRIHGPAATISGQWDALLTFGRHIRPSLAPLSVRIGPRLRLYEKRVASLANCQRHSALLVSSQTITSQSRIILSYWSSPLFSRLQIFLHAVVKKTVLKHSKCRVSRPLHETPRRRSWRTSTGCFCT
jgi:hypothetical protein